MRSKPVETARHFIADWALQILLLLFGTTTLLQAFVVPTGSMEGTLNVGDHLFVDKLAYAPAGAFTGKLLPYSAVRRGDIIVFRYPLDIRENYVKRVIGVPGDRVRIAAKQVWVNGKLLREPYVQHVDPNTDAYRDNFPPSPEWRTFPTAQSRDMVRDHVHAGELVVPPGMYFAMGDNRDNSSDSRYWGFVPRENITGKPIVIYWSYDAPTERLIDPNPRADHLLDIAQHFFTKTRWERMFRPIRAYPLE